MKTSLILPRVLNFTAALVVTAGLLSAGTASAGGNSGQLKGSSLLMKQNTALPVKAAAKSPAMNCPKCRNFAVTRTVSEKGQFKSTVVTQQHLCPSCEQKLVTTGVGKQAKDAVKHQCAENGGMGCMASN